MDKRDLDCCLSFDINTELAPRGTQGVPGGLCTSFSNDNTESSHAAFGQVPH